MLKYRLHFPVCLRAAAAAAKSLQSCLTLCDPEMAAYQALLSLGFSRQEHRSGFFPWIYLKLFSPTK